GSYLSCLDGLTVRVIEARLTMTGADGSRVSDSYRLITTLTGHRRFPAAAVVRLYHERWEIESAYFALRHTLLDGHVLRSGDRPRPRTGPWAPPPPPPAAAPGWGPPNRPPPGPRPGPAQLPPRDGSRPSPAPRRRRRLPRRPRRPARRDRPGRPGHLAARP